MPKLQVIQKISWGSYTRTNGSYRGLPDSFAWRKTMKYNLRYCRLKLFVYGWLIPLLISWVLRKSTKHSTNLKKKKKDKYDKNNLKAVFCLLELLVYIQLVTCTRLSCNAQFSYWFPLFTLFVEDLWKHAASKFFNEIDIFSEKMSLKHRRKIDQISWYYWICLE